MARSRLVGFSPVYETAPVGPVAQGDFLNAAAEIETELAPESLLEAMAAIEVRAGREPRDRRQHWGPRTLDMDLLLYDQQVLSTPTLTVPHPRLHERWFVLRPLADLDPGAMHPVLRRSIGELLAEVELQGVAGRRAQRV